MTQRTLIEGSGDLDLILDYTTWLYDDENPEETPYYLTLENDSKVEPQIRYFYWRDQREYKERIYAFLRISFTLPKKQYKRYIFT